MVIVNNLNYKINDNTNHIIDNSKRIDALEDKVDDLDDDRKAGTASALATAGLLQAYRPSQASLSAAVGQYQSQSAIAVGYSRISDNGKWGIKFSATTNTQKEIGATAGFGYFW